VNRCDVMQGDQELRRRHVPPSSTRTPPRVARRQ
jgi:hypothetical protein